MLFYKTLLTTARQYHHINSQLPGMAKASLRSLSTENFLLRQNQSVISLTTRPSLPAVHYGNLLQLTHNLTSPVLHPSPKYYSTGPLEKPPTKEQFFFNRNYLFWLLLAASSNCLSLNFHTKKGEACEIIESKTSKPENKENIIEAKELSKESVELIVSKLFHNSTVKSLHITNCYEDPVYESEPIYCSRFPGETNFSSKAVQLFIDALTNNGKLNLRTISLRDNYIEFEDMELFLKALSKRCSLLEELNLSSNKIKDKGAAIVAKMLSEHTSMLQVLDLSTCSIWHIGISKIADALVKNTSLKVLNLTQCKFGKDIQNQNIIIFSDDQTGLTAAKKLAFMLEKNTSLETLILAHSDISAKMLSLLTKALTKNNSLKSLDLSDSEFIDCFGTLLRDFLSKNPALQSLNLKGFTKNMSSDQLKILFESLKFNSTLTSLYIGGFCSRTKEENNEILQVLIQYLEKNYTLTTLLTVNDRKYCDITLLNKIDTLLQRNCNLKNSSIEKVLPSPTH